MKKTFAKFGGLLASLALVAALVFTLFGCTSPEKLIEKLTAEDANYTVEMKMNFRGETQTFTARVVGKEFYSKTTDGTDTEYSGLIQDSGKYYMIEGDDETLVKEEITEALFNDYAEEEIGMTTKPSIEILKIFKKYFIKGEDGKYKIDPDQLLAYYNDSLPEAQKVTEVPAEKKSVDRIVANRIRRRQNHFLFDHIGCSDPYVFGDRQHETRAVHRQNADRRIIRPIGIPRTEARKSANARINPGVYMLYSEIWCVVRRSIARSTLLLRTKICPEVNVRITKFEFDRAERGNPKLRLRFALMQTERLPKG